MRNVYLVYGPPCSGKSTYVRKHARPEDTVIDWDDLARKAGSRRKHDHLPEHVKAASRERALLEAQVSDMTDGTAWIIRTLGNPDERQQAAERLRAELMRIDPGGATCIQRAHSTGRQPSTDEQIIRWYANDWQSRALAKRLTGGAIQASTTNHPGLT